MDTLHSLLHHAYLWFRPLFYPLLSPLQSADLIDLLLLDTLLILLVAYFLTRKHSPNVKPISNPIPSYP